MKVLPYAECGPPWISRIIGYFFDASKPGGLRIQPWIFLPSKLVYQISSGSFIVSWLNRSSLNVVSFLDAALPELSIACRSPTTVALDRTNASFWPLASAV